MNEVKHAAIIDLLALQSSLKSSPGPQVTSGTAAGSDADGAFRAMELTNKSNGIARADMRVGLPIATLTGRAGAEGVISRQSERRLRGPQALQNGLCSSRELAS